MNGTVICGTFLLRHACRLWKTPPKHDLSSCWELVELASCGAATRRALGQQARQPHMFLGLGRRQSYNAIVVHVVLCARAT